MAEAEGQAPSEAPPKEAFGQVLRRAPVSAAIVAINVLVFLLAERVGSTKSHDTLLSFGAVWRGAVWEGEYWRLATSMFLHIGVVHLVWNGWMGFRMSSEAERALGPWRFVALYLSSGIVASATSVIGHDAVAAGASGALFGLIGWRLVVLRTQAGSFRAFIDSPAIRRELVNIGIWFVVGAMVGFDNYAHGGGLVFGALFAWMLAAPATARRARTAVTAAVGVVLVASSLRPLPVVHAADRAFLQAQRAVERKQFDEVLAIGDRMVTDFPSDSRGYAFRGVARAQREDLTAAEADLLKAVEIDGNPWAKRNLELLRGYVQQRSGR